VQWNGNSQYRATGRSVHFIVSVSVLIYVSLFSLCFLSASYLLFLSLPCLFVSLWLVGSDNRKPTPLIKVKAEFYASPFFF